MSTAEKLERSAAMLAGKAEKARQAEAKLTTPMRSFVRTSLANTAGPYHDRVGQVSVVNEDEIGVKFSGGQQARTVWFVASELARTEKPRGWVVDVVPPPS